MPVSDFSALEHLAPKRNSHSEFLYSDSEMARLIVATDWSQTPLGPMPGWTEQLKNSLRVCLASEGAVGIIWGHEHTQLYNDAFRKICGDLHPQAFGAADRETLSLFCPEVQLAVDAVFRNGCVSAVQNQRLLLSHEGVPQEHFVTIIFNPILDQDGRVAGVLQALELTTASMLDQRRYSVLQSLGDVIRPVQSFDSLIRDTLSCLSDFPFDLPFVALYEKDVDTDSFNMIETANLASDSYGLPVRLDVAIDTDWRLEEIRSGRCAVFLHDLTLPQAAEAGRLRSAVLLPVREPGCPWAMGFLLCAVNPLCNFDAAYQRFYELLYSVLEAGCRELAGSNAHINQKARERLQPRSVDEQNPNERHAEVVDRLQFALSRAQIGEWVVDLESDVAYCSDQFNRCFGYRHSPHWSLKKFIAHVHPDDRERIETGYKRAIDESTDWHAEFKIVWPDESIHWLSGHGSVYREGSHGARMVGIVSDISVRKYMEETLRATNQRKDEFLAMLAHELRNPLAPISAAAELFETLAADSKFTLIEPVRLAGTARIITRQVKHMTGLIEDLLDVSRVSRGLVEIEKKPVSLSLILDSVMEQVGPLAEAKDHDIDLSGCQQLRETCFILGDEKRLIQIVTNLLVNAIRYTSDGGRISCSAKRESSNNASEAHILLSVEDNGAGMEADLQDTAFDLFSQGERRFDRTQGGLGIGLALVRKLVKLHGGEVECFSDGTGKGSQFTVSLQLTDQLPEEKVSARDDREEAGPEESKSILVVDDNRDAADMLCLLLQSSGHQVRSAYGAEQAFTEIRRDMPNVALLDIGLPDIDGFELARRLRAQPDCTGLRLIAVTGYGKDSDREAALDAGFDHYLVKPVAMDELRSLLR